MLSEPGQRPNGTVDVVDLTLGSDEDESAAAAHVIQQFKLGVRKHPETNALEDFKRRAALLRRESSNDAASQSQRTRSKDIVDSRSNEAASEAAEEQQPVKNRSDQGLKHGAPDVQRLNTRRSSQDEAARENLNTSKPREKLKSSPCIPSSQDLWSPWENTFSRQGSAPGKLMSGVKRTSGGAIKRRILTSLDSTREQNTHSTSITRKALGEATENSSFEENIGGIIQSPGLESQARRQSLQHGPHPAETVLQPLPNASQPIRGPTSGLMVQQSSISKGIPQVHENDEPSSIERARMGQATPSEKEYRFRAQWNAYSMSPDSLAESELQQARKYSNLVKPLQSSGSNVAPEARMTDAFIHPEAFDKKAAVASATSSSIPQNDSLYNGVRFTSRTTASRETDTTRRLLREFQQVSASFAFGRGYAPEEDRLLVHLKEDLQLSWNEICVYFPHRTAWNVLQTRYSKKLKDRSIPAAQEYLDRFPKKHKGRSIISAEEELESLAPIQPTRLRESIRAHPVSSYRIAPLPSLESDEDYEAHQFDSISIPQREEGTAWMTARAIDSPPECKLYTNRRSHSRLKSREQLENNFIRDSAAVASSISKLHRSPLPGLRRKKRASLHIQRPYLTLQQREALGSSVEEGLWDTDQCIQWEGEILHVDFNQDELDIIEPSIHKVRPLYVNTKGLNCIQRLALLLKGASMEDIHRISWVAQTKGEYLCRTRDSIESFLTDLTSENYETCLQASFTRLKLRPAKDVRGLSQSRAAYLRSRELGSSRRAVRPNMSFGPLFTFSRTSSDVNTVAWSSNSATFAVGSYALTDEQSMQYNRPYNLLLGDLSGNLFELPNHSTPRPKQQLFQDPLLFSSVTAAHFAPTDPRVLITAGYDNNVRVWDVANRDGQLVHHCCKFEFPFAAPLDVLAVSGNGLFATGAKQDINSVRIFRYGAHLEPSDVKVGKFSSRQAQEKRESHIYPSSLQWGFKKYLLAGFSGSPQERKGETCIFNAEVEAIQGSFSINARHVFDAKWSPSIFGRFAVACSAAGKSFNKGTKSIVRIYDSKYLANDSLHVNGQRTYELECPAFDINDVVFNPYDDNIISVGCTDGVTYVWDLRNHHDPLHRLAHGAPLHELGDTSRDEADTGVRFLSWGQDRQLYSGSSDGIVACWNPHLSPEDAHQRDVIHMNSGIMAGAFSPDHAQLLVGDVEGSVVVLGQGHEDIPLKDCNKFNLISSKRSHYVSSSVGDGIDEAKNLLESGQLQLRPFGDLPIRQAVQGPNYVGPFDHAPDAPKFRETSGNFQAKAKATETSESTKIERSLLIQDSDITDSGNWRNRIPANVRKEWGKNFETVNGLDQQCFVCGCQKLFRDTSRKSTLDVFQCPCCNGKWRLDVLGFTELKRPQRDQMERLDILEIDQSEDEIDVDNYYLDLWEVDHARLRWLKI